MPMENLAARGSWGIAFLASAGIMAEIIAKACSSPQTTELNAKDRAPTLMKWVNIGMIEGAAFVLAAAILDPRHRTPILLGGIAEGAVTYLEYMHGKSAGLASDEPSTENRSTSFPEPIGGTW